MLRLRFEAYCRVCEPCAARKSLRTHSRPGNDCKKFPVIGSGDQACPGWVRVWGALWRSLGTPDQAGARPERGRRGSQRPSASPGGTATRRGGAQTSAWGAGSPPSTAPPTRASPAAAAETRSRWGPNRPHAVLGHLGSQGCGVVLGTGGWRPAGVGMTCLEKEQSRGGWRGGMTNPCCCFCTSLSLLVVGAKLECPPHSFLSLFFFSCSGCDPGDNCVSEIQRFL